MFKSRYLDRLVYPGKATTIYRIVRSFEMHHVRVGSGVLINAVLINARVRN